MNIYILLQDPLPLWYNYFIACSITPIAIYFTYRLIFQYKQISFDNKRIVIRIPALAKTNEFALEEIDYWTEAKVKTGKNSFYRELKIRFKEGEKIRIAQQEYSEYSKILNYLNTKLPKKRK